MITLSIPPNLFMTLSSQNKGTRRKAVAAQVAGTGADSDSIFDVSNDFAFIDQYRTRGVLAQWGCWLVSLWVHHTLLLSFDLFFFLPRNFEMYS